MLWWLQYIMQASFPWLNSSFLKRLNIKCILIPLRPHIVQSRTISENRIPISTRVFWKQTQIKNNYFNMNSSSHKKKQFSKVHQPYIMQSTRPLYRNTNRHWIEFYLQILLWPPAIVPNRIWYFLICHFLSSKVKWTFLAIAYLRKKSTLELAHAVAVCLLPLLKRKA